MSKFMDWVKKFFDKSVSLFKSFLKEVFTQSTTIVLASIQTAALDIVNELVKTDLSNEEKREEAFDRIKLYIKDEGLNVKDSLINLAIELALTKIKNKISAESENVE